MPSLCTWRGQPTCPAHKAVLGQYMRPLEMAGNVSALDHLPIRVYNYEERASDQKLRVAQETQRQQQRWHAQAAAFINSGGSGGSEEGRALQLAALPFHAYCPQRFRTRRKVLNGANKVFYRSATASLATWIQPRKLVMPDATWINPNVLRFHHYLNIVSNRTVRLNGSKGTANCRHSLASLERPLDSRAGRGPRAARGRQEGYRRTEAGDRKGNRGKRNHAGF